MHSHTHVLCRYESEHCFFFFLSLNPATQTLKLSLLSPRGYCTPALQGAIEPEAPRFSRIETEPANETRVLCLIQFFYLGKLD